VWESVVVNLGHRTSSLFGEEFLSAPIHSLPFWSPNRSFNGEGVPRPAGGLGQCDSAGGWPWAARVCRRHGARRAAAPWPGTCC
jgi:hypothetical protein